MSPVERTWDLFLLVRVFIGKRWISSKWKKELEEIFTKLLATCQLVCQNLLINSLSCSDMKWSGGLICFVHSYATWSQRKSLRLFPPDFQTEAVGESSSSRSWSETRWATPGVSSLDRATERQAARFNVTGSIPIYVNTNCHQFGKCNLQWQKRDLGKVPHCHSITPCQLNFRDISNLSI